jgi:hypothetical protein
MILFSTIKNQYKINFFISCLCLLVYQNTEAQIPPSWQNYLDAQTTGAQPILPNFSFSGYRFSEESLPDISSWAVFDVTNYGAVANDGNYDEVAIQSAINAAQASNGPAVVYFPSGRFRISSDNDITKSIQVNRSNIVLKGSGSGAGGTEIFSDKSRDRAWQFKFMPSTTNASVLATIASPFVIYSDHYNHKNYVTALVNASLSGLLWTPEVRSATSAEEWVRRFQTVCFSPLMQLDAWADATKPWSFPEVTDIIRDNIKLRMDLLPYLYTAFYNYNQKGIPPFRAMVLESGYNATETLIGGKLDGEKNPYEEQKRMEVTDQYMMGPSILVAPVFTGETERKVVLPSGNWYNFYTGALVGNGETITIKTKIEQIPLFVKDGAIIPMLSSKEMKSTDEPSLEVRHYGTKENTFQLYNDDGETFNYEKGDCTLLELKVTKGKSGKLKGQSKFINNKNYSYGKVNWLWMSN